MPDLTFPIAIVHAVVFGMFCVLIFTSRSWEKIFFGLMGIGSLVLAIFSLAKGHPNDAIAIGAFAVMMLCAFVVVVRK